jgi:hypothetical protein
MIRRVEPELLDTLPPHDPRAVRSRRDLRLINAWMGNARHIARAIRALPESPRRIVELGAGDGTLLLKIAAHLSGPIELWLLDMQPVISPETLAKYGTLGWKVQVIASRLEDWLQNAPENDFHLIVANLFLHHFDDHVLKGMFARLARRTRAFISCDPRRYGPALFATHFLWGVGCNDVTRHDARVSVRGGFRDRELSALWPAESGFHLREHAAGFASHLLCAFR